MTTSYTNLEVEHAKYKDIFDLYTHNGSRHYKILYLLKHTKLGNIVKVTGHIPRKTEFLFKEDEYSEQLFESTHITSSSSEEDESRAEHSFRRRPKKRMNTVYRSKYSIQKYCKKIILANSTIINSSFTISVINKKGYFSLIPLQIRKKSNIWIVDDPGKEYMNIIYNGKKKRKIKKKYPDSIQVILPKSFLKDHHFFSSIVNRTLVPSFYWKKNLYTSYHNFDRDCLDLFHSKTPILSRKEFSSDINNIYTLSFIVKYGIASEKNSIIIHINDVQETNSYMETIKVNDKMIAIIYKNPFSILHAFAYGLTRIHSN